MAEGTFDTRWPFLPSLPHICVYCPHGLEIFLPSFLFFDGLLNMWEGFMCVLIQVLRHCSSVGALSFRCSSWVVYSNICLSYFIFTWGQRNMRLLLGHWKSSFSEAMYQMICFRFCSRIRRILHHIIPRKGIAFFEDTFFRGRIAFLCLLMFCYCFLRLNLLWMHLSLISLKVHHLVVFLLLTLRF